MYFSGLRARVDIAAKRAARTTVALILMGVGAGFFAGALWIALAEMQSPLFASLILGGLFFGLGLLVLGWASMSAYKIPPEQLNRPMTAATLTGSPLPALVEAFVVGMTAGTAARTRR